MVMTQGNHDGGYRAAGHSVERLRNIHWPPALRAPSAVQKIADDPDDEEGTASALVRRSYRLTWVFGCGADGGNRTRVFRLGPG